MQKSIDEIEEYKASLTEHRRNNVHNMFKGPYICPMCKKDQLFSTKIKTDNNYIFVFECKNIHCRSTFKELDAKGSIIDAYNRLIDRVG
jgi:transcription elongation factor Elf1